MSMCLSASVENSVMSVTKKGFEERVATVCFRKEKSPKCSTMLVINFPVNCILLDSTCFYFPQMPPKMTKFVLNDMFEDTKLFLERVSNSDQIKSSMFFSL